MYEEPRNLYASPNIIRVIKSNRMRWAGHVAHMGEMRNAHSILVRNPEGRRPLGRPADGKIILECLLEKWSEKMYTRCSWLNLGTSGRAL
jgi:hypothetical protein